ncbi:hypothetical protein G6O69_04265 [Pseudenhygromyxa sp. WMMC2535]|uniref:phage baseplate assembly protein V n=1 Tax=Pseudenhygromyxa sp. WMMC2535 TaxID=2712867 RepID=UPI0015578405|nr:phage baseplate assembly protein V [Pseudenhygromyxa sp. WMMC2535]NVB37032.1 hypothetical protein [Pseudenhygromyxa sp. WMMC2535]
MKAGKDTVEQLREDFDALVRGRFYGKYAGVVSDVEDPMALGRLRAKVPAVLGETVESGWALPCAAFGGGADRGAYALPEVGDNVWIEFAEGDPSRPIWTGSFWSAPQGESEIPEHAAPGQLVVRTAAGHTIHVDDEGGTIVIQASDGATTLTIDAAGKVVIDAATIELGAGASEALVLGNAFMQLFNQHTHSTGVGPSGPPTPTMTPSQLSSVSSSK